MFSFSFRERLKFLWHSKNAHGLHSPFVFTFYNAIKKQAKDFKANRQGLRGFTKKENRILYAVFQELNPSSVLVISEEYPNEWSTLFSRKAKVSQVDSLNKLSFDSVKFDIAILSNSLLINQKEILGKLLPLLSNDSIVIIPHIHASKPSIIQWKNWLEDKNVRVSIDMFFIGLIFFRKESTKEDFLLRF